MLIEFFWVNVILLNAAAQQYNHILTKNMATATRQVQGQILFYLNHVTGQVLRLYLKLDLLTVVNDVNFWSSMFCCIIDMELSDREGVKEL